MTNRDGMKNKDAEKNNPCLKEMQITYKCFNDKNFNKEECQAEIANYKACKDFWYFVQKDRRKHGIRPVMPPVEERAQVKKEYFARFSL